jgi:sec-independent protein translocase protein TatA
MTTSTALVAGVFGLGAPELILILVILLVLFGGAKLPALAKGLGQSVKEFKKAAKEAEADDEKPAAEAKKPEAAKTHGSN